MKVINIHFRPAGGDQVEVRIYAGNPAEATIKTISAAELRKKANAAFGDYQSAAPKRLRGLGESLYRWLNGATGDLDRWLAQPASEGTVLALGTEFEADLFPWELLHDGSDFLVNRRPAVVPVRRCGNRPASFAARPASARALNVIFMAAAPAEAGESLDYEFEEAQILRSTKRHPVGLFVEESGNINELREYLSDHDPGYFDVLHLSSHATADDGKTRLLLETEYGGVQLVSAQEVADAIQFQSPPAIFVSACITGTSQPNSAISSFAEELVRLGATNVLAWGRSVKDAHAINAAGHFYEVLASGKSIVQALALTYQKLLTSGSADWHELRLFTNGTLFGALVQRGHKPVSRSVVTRFIDTDNRLRVVSREEFVGRRRQLQSCFRALSQGAEGKIGVLLLGMGGLGKSAIASRLVERLRDFDSLVLWRQFDEFTLIRSIAEHLPSPDARRALLSDEEYLSHRLKRALTDVARPLLFVFDDFEWNLVIEKDGHFPRPEVEALLKTLASVIATQGLPHKIIITSRYDFKSAALMHFHQEPLDALSGVDLEKKLRHLAWFEDRDANDAIRTRALALADGNPRLLEFLNQSLRDAADPSALLDQFQASAEAWKARVIWDDLYPQVDADVLSLLSCALVFHIPLPASAFNLICRHVDDGDATLARARQAGLIEASARAEGGERRYRISRILPRIFPGLEECQGQRRVTLCAEVAAALRKEWAVAGNESAVEWLEFFRLAMEADPSPKSLRALFGEMLSVQFNEPADRAFERALFFGSVSLDLSLEVLETCLRNKKWREADVETAWLLYQQVVQLKLMGMGFDQLFSDGPSDLLLAIDQLWVRYSDGRFGFSVQKALFEDRFEQDWVKFAISVRWAKKKTWAKFSEMKYSAAAPVGHLPLLPMCRGTWSRGGSYPRPIGTVGFTMNLFGYGWRIGGSENFVFSRSTFNY